MPHNPVDIDHGVRQSDRRRMSKSLHNGINRMEVIEKHGADLLRLFLITSSTIGEDLFYSEDKIISMSKFLNKLWNIANFIDMKIINSKIDKKAAPDFLINELLKNPICL